MGLPQRRELFCIRATLLSRILLGIGPCIQCTSFLCLAITILYKYDYIHTYIRKQYDISKASKSLYQSIQSYCKVIEQSTASTTSRFQRGLRKGRWLSATGMRKEKLDATEGVILKVHKHIHGRFSIETRSLNQVLMYCVVCDG